MKKIMHLISTDVFSGAENVACQIINGFSKDEKYKMIYVSKIGPNKKSLENRSITYYKLNNFNYKCIKKAIQDFKPDIIHAHDIKASIYASLFYNKAVIISHIHGNHENMRKFNIKTFLYNMFSKKFNKIIWVSKSCLDDYYYSNKVQRKSIILYNVINPEELEQKAKLDKNNYSYDLIYLGRLSYPKNPIRLIEVIKEIVAKRPSTTVAIVGTGELEQDVKETIHKYGLEKNITLYGFQSNPYKILKSSKIMIMTSRYEGTPMCALEAFACGIPIISTPTDGLKELINDGKNGYIGETNKLLIEKTLYLLNNEKIYAQIANQVKKDNKEINDIHKYLNNVNMIYKGCIK